MDNTMTTTGNEGKRDRKTSETWKNAVAIMANRQAFEAAAVQAATETLAQKVDGLHYSPAAITWVLARDWTGNETPLAVWEQWLARVKLSDIAPAPGPTEPTGWRAAVEQLSLGYGREVEDWKAAHLVAREIHAPDRPRMKHLYTILKSEFHGSEDWSNFYGQGD